MINEAAIRNAKEVVSRLNKEIKESTEDTQEKEDLAGILNVVINMPNLLKEQKQLNDAIGRSRDTLTSLEDDVKKEKGETAVMLSSLRKTVLDEETHVSDVKQEKAKELEIMAVEHGKTLSDERSKMEAGIKIMQDRGAAEKKKYDDMKTELGAMEAKLKTFKSTVASM
jgi:hypothetical protein